MKRLFHKTGVGTKCPRVQRRITRMRIIVAASNCILALASRRAKYDGDL
jgi:hypothetical protein